MFFKIHKEVVEKGYNLSINNISSVNINPFSAVAQPKASPGTVYFNNFFDTKDTSVQNIPLQTAQINSLYLKDDLLAQFLPQNFIIKYLNNGFISKQVQNNPRIKELLQQKGLPISVNPKNVIEIIDSHLIPTLNYAKMIMQKSEINFSAQDYSQMEQAALLHDIGKLFIPTEILNKKNNLTEQERKIIELHDILGVELLKGTTLSNSVLNLIKSHHNYNGNEDNGILTQILKIADIYSALKENRAYKAELSDEETFKSLYNMANNGEFNPKLVDILKQAINSEQLPTNTMA